MARKKKEPNEPRRPYNPYYGRATDPSNMPEKPVWTWRLAVPGLILGAVIGVIVREPVLGVVFGGVMGIAVGSLIDKHREKAD